MKTSPHHPAVIWACNIGFAIMIAYAAGPAGSSILIAAEEWGGLPQAITTNAVMAIPAIAFVVSLIWLSRMPTIQRRVGNGLKTAGILLLTALPVLIGVAFIENMRPAGPDHGAGVAAVYMVFLFGGAYGILGAVLLVAGVVILRRERRAAAAL